jgi:hypothetical protein
VGRRCSLHVRQAQARRAVPAQPIREHFQHIQAGLRQVRRKRIAALCDAKRLHRSLGHSGRKVVEERLRPLSADHGIEARGTEIDHDPVDSGLAASRQHAINVSDDREAAIHRSHEGLEGNFALSTLDVEPQSGPFQMLGWASH